MTAPDELRLGHLLLDPGGEDDPPKVWAVTAYHGKEGTVIVRSSGFGEAQQRKIHGQRLPPGWKFIHSELLAGLLGRHLLAATADAGSDLGCAVCAVFGGPGTVETIQEAGH
jgi:hypothetical protein